MPPQTKTRPQTVNRLLKNVASGLQPGASGAQEPECTEGVHEDSEHRTSPDQGRAVVFQQPVKDSTPRITSAADLRAAARRGEWRGTTAGHCPAYQQANLVILPTDAAVEFAAFCTRNPVPCPLIEITPPGDPEPVRSAPGADLRTDCPGYRVYRKGELVEQRGDIRDLWRGDLVAFLLGCSLTFEHALIEADITPRNVECNTKVPMFVSNLACLPAGRFHGPMVVSMRPIPQAQVERVRELSSRYPHAHGAPIHIGDPNAIGISDLNKPEYGESVPVHDTDIPMFWGCGVTPQAVAASARIDFMITHEPGQMFLTDLPREGGRTSLERGRD